MNITYTKKLYLSDERIDKDAVRADILREKPKRGMFVLVMPPGGKDLLDIMPAKELNKPIMKDRDITVVGLAKGYRRSVKLAERIIGDAYAFDNGLDLHGYFSH
ncbi:MAG: hypothetical protein IJT32_06935 [Lachnospiraceae bacterium]|nr:hypothetical protein [Lachnospiraceae bacterium]